MFDAFVLDVDGVMTTGQFLYDSNGKSHKVFGPDDSDALSIIRNHLKIRFVTADKRGYAISHKRICEDMGYSLDLVPAENRFDWVRSRFDVGKVIYMGDGFFDGRLMRQVGYGIAPANAAAHVKSSADFVTQRTGGDRAVAEAVLHILEELFNVALDSLDL